MTPCSSGNSPTMPVNKSALQSSAARSATMVSTPNARAISPAKSLILSVRSSWLPSLLWNTTFANCGTRVSRRAFLSWLEEARILEPGPDHPLVAADDWARVIDAHIGDDEEFRQQLTVGGEQRKILLILAHGEDQAFVRHLEKRGVEFARVNGRQLDKRGDFFQQVLILTEARLLALGLGLQLLVDFRFAFREVGDDMTVLEQLCLVLVRAA